MASTYNFGSEEKIRLKTDDKIKIIPWKNQVAVSSLSDMGKLDNMRLNFKLPDYTGTASQEKGSLVYLVGRCGVVTARLGQYVGIDIGTEQLILEEKYLEKI